MNRHYDTALFADLCRRLRELFPDCALTTDVMVGFPGETEEEFSRSLAFVQEIGFARVHVFSYSRRPGTVADRLPRQVPAAVKAQRSKRLIAACGECANRYAAGYVGRQTAVLLETPMEDGTVIGHTDTYLTVRVHTRHQSGELIPVTVTACEGDTLLGEECKESIN